MFRTASALATALLLWLFASTAAAQITVGITPGAGTVIIDQPDGNPTLTCPTDCATVPGVNNPNDSTFTFTINPAPGWQLVRWVVDNNNNVAPTNSVQLGPFPSSVFGNVQAVLEKVMSVTVDGPGQGQVTSDDGAIVCGSGQTCTATYDPVVSDPVVLTATPDVGSVFTGWDLGPSGVACIFEGGPTCTVDPTQTGVGGLPNAITATFDLEDSDDDGVPDIQDLCPNTPPNESVDSDGCPLGMDSDGDGVDDVIDLCPNTPMNTPVDSDGCPLGPTDSDGDGVNNGTDLCPNTPMNTPVDSDGCPLGPTDSDGDGVDDGTDLCPNTPMNTPVDTSGCPLTNDADGDRVLDSDDQCPNTPPGTPVDSVGCPPRPDNDGDGVTVNLDLCPNTPAGTPVDEFGCPLPVSDGGDGMGDGDMGGGDNGDDTVEDPPDTDGDGVIDDNDQCPNTPMGTAVDDVGCPLPPPDEDGDGVIDGEDVCPGTPAGEEVDVQGCSDSQKDTDGDGVDDATDQCPDTPMGEAVDALGCSDTQKDTDSDGVNDATDQCPATPMGETVDAVGCSDSQRDDDNDGVVNIDDQCPNTPPGAEVLPNGCTPEEEEIRDFGPALVEVEGLSSAQRSVAGNIDALCPALIALDAAGDLDPAQQDLRERCSTLKNGSTSQDQQRSALAAITPDDFSKRTDLALEVGRTQLRLIYNRVNRIRRGGGRGFSASDLTVSFAGTDVDVGTIEQAAAADSGSGSSDFSDFGNWGFYLQGDIEVGERDSDGQSAGYDFDYWLLSAGADYRFGATGYAGLSLDFGSSVADGQFSESDGDIFGATVYGGLNLGERGYVDVILAYLEQDYSITRDVEYTDFSGDFSARYLGDTSGSHYSAAVNLGYNFDWKGLRIGPMATLQYIDGDIDGYAEEAAAGSSLAWAFEYGARDYGLTAIAVGLQADYAWLMDWGVLMPGFRFTLNSDDESSDLRSQMGLMGDPFAGDAPIILDRTERDNEYWESAFSLAGQFSYGISAYTSFRWVGSRGGYSQRGYTVGLRWDKVF